MRMRSYILWVVVCSLLSFIAANRISYKPGSNSLLATVSAQPPLGSQCPPCTANCLVVGVSASSNPGFPESCSVNNCTGSTIKNNVVISGNGRDMVLRSTAQCTFFDESGQQQTCGTVEDQSVISNACCPAGQTQPHYSCQNGNCVIVQACGQNVCQGGEFDCPCPPGQTRPHHICDGSGNCQPFMSCRQSNCQPGEVFCPCAPGNLAHIWSA